MDFGFLVRLGVAHVAINVKSLSNFEDCVSMASKAVFATHWAQKAVKLILFQ